MGLSKLGGHMCHNWTTRKVKLEELVRTSKSPNRTILIEYLRLHSLFFEVPYPEVKAAVASFVSRIEAAGGSVVAWCTTRDIVDQEAIAEKKIADDTDCDYEELIRKSPEKFESVPYFLYADRHVVYDAFDSAKVKLHHGSRHEMIAFANENNCVAIIAQDCDFMIFDMTPKYLQMQSLELETLEVAECNRRDVMACFRLENNEQLLAFASLIGGTAVKISKLEALHSMLKVKYKMSVLPAVAKYVREESMERINSELRICLDTETVTKIEETQEYYSLKEIFTDALEESPMMPIKIQWTNLVLLYFIDHCFGSKIRIFTDYSDCSREDPIPANKVRILPLRKKLYSLIFKKRRSITEIYSYEEDGSREIRFQSPNIPSNIDLGRIQSEDPSPDLQDLRWRLFVDAVSSQSSVAQDARIGDFRRLPPHLVIPLSGLIYLQDTGSSRRRTLQPEELRYLLATILYVSEKSKTIDMPSRLSLRSLHVITMFLNACNLVHMLNTLCGWVISPRDASFSKWFCKKVATVMSCQPAMVDYELNRLDHGQLALDLLRKYSTVD